MNEYSWVTMTSSKHKQQLFQQLFQQMFNDISIWNSGIKFRKKLSAKASPFLIHYFS